MLFKDRQGRLRAGWLLAVAALVWGLADVAARAALTAAFRALFAAWRIDAGNARLAPAWARLVYGWHGSFVTLATALLTILAALLLRRWWKLPLKAGSLKTGGRLALIGLGAAAGSAALFLLMDSLRPEWPLTRPHLTAGLPVLLILSLISVFASELFGRGAVYAMLAERWGRLWATLAASLMFTLATGLGGGAIGMVNALLMGALCCLLYDRRGLCASAGLRWGWSAANMLLLGFGGGDSGVYRLYAVSEVPLTGGDAGFMCGLWATALLLCGIAWTEREALKALFRGMRKGR